MLGEGGGGGGEGGNGAQLPPLPHSPNLLSGSHSELPYLMEKVGEGWERGKGVRRRGEGM